MRLGLTSWYFRILLIDEIRKQPTKALTLGLTKFKIENGEQMTEINS